MYHASSMIVASLFVAIILGSLFCTIFFVWASVAIFYREEWQKKAVYAFIASLMFWFLFFFADQFTMRFDLIENHMVQGGIEMLCLFIFLFVPDKIDY